MNIFSVLTLIGGLALFLYGMDSMGEGLKKLSGGKLEGILASLTSTRLRAFFLGFAVTAIIQSSSATTVMLVGFVNAGIMSLGQTLGIILGANIGTTVTAWLLSLTGISGEASFILKLFKPTSFTPILAAIGVIMTMVGKKDKHKNLGIIFIGFAVLMFGMDTMSDAMDGLGESQTFKNLLVMFENPILGIISGTLLTAILQSSSASVGILQALSLASFIPVSTALPIILGQNIGTTITPVLSSISGNTDSKRVALACVYIKIIGVVIITIAFYALHSFMDFSFMHIKSSPLNIAIVHTTFNILSTIILMPFCKIIEKLVTLSIKGKKDEKQDVFSSLDERFLSMPAFAVETCRQLVSDMATRSKKAMLDSIVLLDNYDEDLANQIIESETEIDLYEDKTSSYLLKVSERTLSQKDSREVSQLLHVIGDIERISDHSINILEAAQEINTKNITFSKEAQKELSIMANAVREILSLSIEALTREDINLAKKVEPLEQIIDKLKYKIKNNHIDRLRQGNCTIELGFVLSDILNNFERVADHCSNIAVCLIEIDNNSFETHEYLHNVKETGANEFFEYYDMYKQRYSL